VNRWDYRALTDIRAGNSGHSYPCYIAGEHNGPPENCGSISSFSAILCAAI
jgi:hypothetical protein